MTSGNVESPMAEMFRNVKFGGSCISITIRKFPTTATDAPKKIFPFLGKATDAWQHAALMLRSHAMLGTGISNSRPPPCPEPTIKVNHCLI